MDKYCRLYYECDMNAKIQLHRTGDILNSFVRNCECGRKFINVLKSHFAFGGLYAFIFSLNINKCYEKDYPIIKCNKYQYFFDLLNTFDEFPNGRGIKSIRCLEYELDRIERKMYQLFDSPFHLAGITHGKFGVDGFTTWNYYFPIYQFYAYN